MALNALNYILILVAFSSSLVFRDVTIVDVKISYLIMVLCFFPLFFVCKWVIFNKKTLIILLIITIPSVVNIYIGNNSWGLLVRSWLGITLSSLIFYLLIKANNYDLSKLFRVYLNLAFLVGLIGLFQELSYLIDFRFGYDFSWFLPSWKVCMTRSGILRVNSILPEPVAFCYCMIPAFYVAASTLLGVDNKLLTKPKSLVVVCSIFLTISLIGYIGITFCVLSIFSSFHRKRYLVICLILIAFFLGGAYLYADGIRMRIDDSVGVLRGSKTADEVNLSTFTYFTNLAISYYSFVDHPLFGSGLGSRELTYYTYIDKVVGNTNHRILNTKDGNSLFLRIATELGLFGLALVAMFIYRFHVKRKEKVITYLWLISNAVLVLFVLKFLRGGHYFNNGVFFFVWLYYFAGKEAINQTKYLFNCQQAGKIVTSGDDQDLCLNY